MSARATLTPWRLAWVGLVGGLLLWTRLVGLDRSLWNDEAYTVLRYINQGPGEVLAGAYASNDHELFNLLAWATTSVLGESEPLYRLWSVVPAIAAVAWFMWWSWRRLDPWIAIAFGFLITISPLELDLTKQARGYGLATLSAVGMIVAADSAIRTRSRRALVAFGGLGLVGVLSFPMVVLPFVALAGVLLLEPGLRRKVTVTMATAAIAATAFYAPHLGGMVREADQRWSTLVADATSRTTPQRKPLEAPSAGWRGFVKRPLGLVAPDTRLLVTGDHPLCDAYCFDRGELVAYGGIPALLMLIGAISLWRRRMRRTLALLAAPPAFTFVLLTLWRYSPEDRLVIYLAPYLLMLAAIGLWQLGAHLPGPRYLRPAVVIAGGLIALLGAERIVRLTDELNRLPKENFKQVGAIVNGSDIRRVVTNSVRPVGLEYYIRDPPLEVLHLTRLEQLFCRTHRPVVYIDHPLFSKHADTACLTRRGAIAVRVRQRDRGEHIDVWLLHPSGT